MSEGVGESRDIENRWPAQKSQRRTINQRPRDGRPRDGHEGEEGGEGVEGGEGSEMGEGGAWHGVANVRKQTVRNRKWDSPLRPENDGNDGSEDGEPKVIAKPGRHQIHEGDGNQKHDYDGGDGTNDDGKNDDNDHGDDDDNDKVIVRLTLPKKASKGRTSAAEYRNSPATAARSAPLPGNGGGDEGGNKRTSKRGEAEKQTPSMSEIIGGFEGKTDGNPPIMINDGKPETHYGLGPSLTKM